MVRKILTVTILLGATYLQLPANAQAQADEGFFCAAVFPCDMDTGELQEWAKQGECAAEYKRVCDSYTVNSLKSCMQDMGVMANTIASLENKNSDLQKDLEDEVKAGARKERKIRRLKTLIRKLRAR